MNLNSLMRNIFLSSSISSEGNNLCNVPVTKVELGEVLRSLIYAYVVFFTDDGNKIHVKWELLLSFVRQVLSQYYPHKSTPSEGCK